MFSTAFCSCTICYNFHKWFLRAVGKEREYVTHPERR